MAKSYNLTFRAEEDLSDIWKYTTEVWNEIQADRYIAGLYKRFSWLAEFPRLGKHRPQQHKKSLQAAVHRKKTGGGNFFACSLILFARHHKGFIVKPETAVFLQYPVGRQQIPVVRDCLGQA